MKAIHSISIDEFGTAMILFEPPREGMSARQVEIIPDSMIADIASDGRTVGIEILDPKIVEHFFSPAITKLFKKYKIEHPIS
jgi:hypothetical protein